jgi:hypothetical protein
MQTSQGYSFYILQHFATKFCNFTDFNKFFTGIYFFLPKSKISLTCKLSIAATCNKILFLRMLIESVYTQNYKSRGNMCQHFYLTCVEIGFCCKLQQFCYSYYSSLNVPSNNSWLPTFINSHSFWLKDLKSTIIQ